MANLTPTQFVDLQGSVWDTAITVAAAKRVDSVDYSAVTREKFSLLRPMDSLQGFFGEIMSNTAFMFAVLFDIMFKQVFQILSKDPVIHRAEAELEFSERMGGQQIVDARRALWSALSDFFPDQKTVLQRLRESYDEGLKLVEDKINEFEPQAKELLMQKVVRESEKLREQLMAELRG